MIAKPIALRSFVSHTAPTHALTTATMLTSAAPNALIFVTFILPLSSRVRARDAARQPLNVNREQFELRSRERESGGIIDCSLPVEKHDDGIVTVQQLIDLLVNTPRILPE
jgi:hypothetical protein